MEGGCYLVRASCVYARVFDLDAIALMNTPYVLEFDRRLVAVFYGLLVVVPVFGEILYVRSLATTSQVRAVVANRTTTTNR